jgi:hypothetical protein
VGRHGAQSTVPSERPLVFGFRGGKHDEIFVSESVK